MNLKIGSIHPPEFPLSIPKHSQWLSGQGAGTWFAIDKTNVSDQFLIRRFTPEGTMDCERIFRIEDNGSVFHIDQPYQFTHISHCSKCKIIQNDVIFTFYYVAN